MNICRSRRNVVLALGTSIFGLRSKTTRVAAQDSAVELEVAEFDASDAEIAVPRCNILSSPSFSGEPAEFTGDMEALWRSPWDIGMKTFEIGCVIVQRFVGTETQGFKLGVDGLVFQSVIYGKFGFQQYFFAGVNSDLADIEGARTLMIIGTYGGVQHNTDSGWDDPVVIVKQLVVPD